MTREEAIEVLKRDIHNAKVTHHLSEHYEMAIKALEQEPCEDAVSRQTVLDELRTCFDTHSIYDENNGENYIIYEDAVDMMEKLQPVTPTQRWISVSERLPKENGFYLVTIVFDIDEIESERDVTKAYFCFPSKKWQYFSNDEVIAWTPLPEPYKAESEEE